MMETTNDNIRQLMDMLDNPDAYTEQEIRDIINRDEDTRETYRMMVEAKRSSRHRQNHQPADVDAAWQRFNQRLQPKRQGFSWVKAVAMFVGVLMISGIVYATVRLISSSSKQENKVKTEVAQVPDKHQQEKIQEQTDSTVSQVRVFEDAELSAMLSEMVSYYHCEVVYQNEEVKHIRLYFTWDKRQSIDEVIEIDSQITAKSFYYENTIIHSHDLWLCLVR